MPKPSEGESEDRYVSRCIPIVIKEGTAKDASQAAAICHSMWEQHQEDSEKKTEKVEEMGELKEYTFECSLHEFAVYATLKTEKDTTSIEMPKEGWTTFKAVAVIGDRMMKNVYVPYESLKQTIDLWNGTYHDLNHMGTSYPDTVYPFKRQNIDYIVGYQNNAFANDQTKEISMNVNINKNSPKYASWKSFVDINKEANKIPNVSMSIMARSKRIKAKDLNFDASSYGFKDDDMIDCLYDIYPKALTTCIEGECNSTKGCGLAVNNECDDCKCKDGKCKVETPVSGADEKCDSKDAEKLAYLKNRINKLKEEKNHE